MPVHLFTFHAYGSWLPDKPQGYVERGKGVRATDPQRASVYRERMTAETVAFSPEHQQALVEACLRAQTPQRFRLHAVACERTHLHVLMSWETDASVMARRDALKKSLSLALNRAFGRRAWFSRGASRKRVRDREHFETLMRRYLPAHGGLVWREGDD